MWSWKTSLWSIPLHPRVLEDLSSTEAQSCVPNQQLGYEILGPLCDVSPVLVRKFILALLDALKQVTLAGSAGFSSVPATVCATVACEGGAAAQQDVEDDPEAPKVTALVVEGRLISEHLHHFWSHVLC